MSEKEDPIIKLITGILCLVVVVSLAIVALYAANEKPLRHPIEITLPGSANP